MLTQEFNEEIEKFKQMYSKGYLMMCRNAPRFTSGLDSLFALLDSKYYESRNQLQQAQVTISKYKAQVIGLQKQIQDAKNIRMEELPKEITRRIRESRKEHFTDNQASVLYWIQNSDKPLTVHELSKFTGLPFTTTFGIVNNLELRKFITTSKKGRARLCKLRLKKDITSDNTSAPQKEKMDGTRNEGGLG